MIFVHIEFVLRCIFLYLVHHLKCPLLCSAISSRNYFNFEERWIHNLENKDMHFIAEKIREAKQFQFSRIVSFTHPYFLIPLHFYICSVVNTGKTLDGIETCGLRAAKEVTFKLE